ncbi:hypothetical protein [Streptomyces sp. NPDC020983]|uniref:hypothetical protein n=1 Tax=Streptomyces sp. NPDC020983 TaxID=3365106 RepID=UPI00379D4E1C
MPSDAAAPIAATHSLWTIARIQDVLTSPVLVRRFLLDLAHAPEPEVMNVFTAWRRVAATIEAHAARSSASETVTAPERLAEGRL